MKRAPLIALLSLAAGTAHANTAKGGLGAGRWAKEHAAVTGENKGLETHALGFKPSHSWSLGGKSAGARQVIGDKGSLVVRLRSKPEKFVRANRTLQLLAAQLGQPEMVPSAVTLGIDMKGFTPAKGEGGGDVMVMSFIGEPFQQGHKASSSRLGKITEETRVVGAVIDLLTQQRDRKMANLLVDKTGNVRLIDPDRVFKAKTEKEAYRSQFFAGGHVGYKGRQDSLSDLPPKAQQLIKDLASAKPADIKEFYGVNDDEAEVMQTQARAIQKLGLTGASEQYVRTLRVKHDWRN